MFSFRRGSRSEISPAAPSFPYPLPACPPIAIISSHFPDDAIALAEARTIAAPMSTIRSIDRTNWSPDFPIVVLSNIEDGLIAEADRDYIWQSFGVPMFEYLLGSDGKIIARECEAHDGLHLDAPAAGTVTTEPCPCGRPGNRLLSLTTEDQSLNAIIKESDPVRMWRNWQTRQT